MTEHDSLLRLADLAGIGRGYQDAWGQRREIPAETFRALLETMEVPCATAEEVGAGIVALEAEGWRALLPPAAVVCAEDAEFHVPLTVPRRLAGGLVLWWIDCEDGTARDGALAFDALATLAHDAGERGRYAVPLPRDLPLGYHRLRVEVGEENAETVLISVPRRCFLPADLARGERCWGLTTQLYSLRSMRNWGIGDFTDLGVAAELAAKRGARLLGVNPLHALFPAVPGHISPYSPSTRFFLNPLYIDIEAVPDLADCPAAQQRLAAPEFRAALAQARIADQIDHAAVSALKLPLLDLLYRSFAERHLGTGKGEAPSPRGGDFRRFQQDGGVRLEAYALFNALHRRFFAERGCFSWRDWPAELHDAGSEDIKAAADPAAVECFQYMEWEADRQLGAAMARGAAAGLDLGLYRDMAVGVDRNGAEAWSDPTMLASGAAVGAPPDLLNLMGQNWGFAPANPVALRRQSYAPFIAALRANMRHAGVLRLDHVMALRQLYWIPQGASAAAGAYVAYPFEDLLGILALESQRHRCAVVGEDLGTVPEGFRERLAAAGVLSYRVLLFEREPSGKFLPPAVYPPLSAATFSTHDIPTLKGYWLGRDLAWRTLLSLYPDDAARERDQRERHEDRYRMIDAMIGAGVLSADAIEALLPGDGHTPVYTLGLAEAVHRYLGRTASSLALLQIEDALGEEEQANLPGTVDEHPNWRRKLSRPLEELGQDPAFLRVTAAIDAGRKEPSSTT